MSDINTDHEYVPSTHPGDIIEVWDEESGTMVKQKIVLDEFGNGTKTRPLEEGEDE